VKLASTGSGGRSRRTAGVAAASLVALGLAGLALRPQLVAIGPLVAEIELDLGASHAAIALLTTIPVLSQGLCALAAPRLMRRIGASPVAAASLCLLAVFGIVRAAAPTTAALVALTIPVGLAMGFALASLPALVKTWLADRPAFATGVYSTGLNVGSSAAAASAVPLADAGSGWQTPLLVFSVLTLPIAVAWWRLTPRRAASPPMLVQWRTHARRPAVWLVVALFTTTSAVFYGFVSWLADAYVERGWDEAEAGRLLAAMSIASIAASLLVPWLADRHGSRRLYLVLFCALQALAAAGVVVWADGAWLWAAAAGVAIGVIFPLTLTLPLDLSATPADVAAISGVVLGAGYGLSALSPIVLGALREATASFDAGFATLAATGAVAIGLAAMLGPRRLTPSP
jgi:MFS transporter, CP family, cyanate transporter